MRNRLLRLAQRPLFAILCASALFTSFAPAQQPDATLYSGLRWRMIGPFRGGRSIAVSGIEGQPNVYYFGAVGGGVWKTTNGGVTWEPIFDGQPIGSIGALAIAPSDPNIIYAGTGEADLRSDLTYGNGVYKSTDGGKTWSNIGLRDSQHIGRILVDPKNAAVVLVAALGHAYGPNTQISAPLSCLPIRTTQQPCLRRCCMTSVRRGALILLLQLQARFINPQTVACPGTR